MKIAMNSTNVWKALPAKTANAGLYAKKITTAMPTKNAKIIAVLIKSGKTKIMTSPNHRVAVPVSPARTAALVCQVILGPAALLVLV